MRMRKDHVFRPRLSEILETRAVPSMAGVTTTVATGIPGISVTLPPQISLANPKVQAAFVTLDQSYVRAVDALLSAPESNGLFAPSNGRATFVSSIEQSLNTFVEQPIASLGTGSTTTTTTGSTTTTTTGSTTTSTVANQVTTAIVGGDANSLESQLLGLSLAELALSVPNTSAPSGSPAPTVVANVVSTAEQVRQTLRVPVAEATGPSQTGSDPASTTSSVSTPSTKAADDVRSAFNNFLNDYFKAVQGVLLSPGSNGQASPSANRQAFDAKVSQAIQSLETRLTTSLSRYPATSGLGPQIQSSLAGAGASSLQTQLSKLATPQGAQSSVVRDFTLGSTQAIAQVLALIGADVARLMGPAGP